MDLAGKTIVMTGATSGIGLASVKQLVASGACVIGIGRSAQRNHEAKQIILSEVPNARVNYFLADLASQSQVRSLVEDIKIFLEGQKINALDVLVNNAGIYSEKKQMTEDGIEKTFAVNHLAPFLLSHECCLC